MTNNVPVAELGSFLKSMLSNPAPDPIELNRFPELAHPLDLALQTGFSDGPVRRAWEIHEMKKSRIAVKVENKILADCRLVSQPISREASVREMAWATGPSGA